jgi:hypothetical protein
VALLSFAFFTVSSLSFCQKAKSLSIAIARVAFDPVNQAAAHRILNMRVPNARDPNESAWKASLVTGCMPHPAADTEWARFPASREQRPPN